MMPQSDSILESVYDLINKQSGEQTRVEVARTALLAAQYRALQLQQQRMQQAVERRAAERKALIRDGGSNRSDPAVVAVTQPGVGERMQ